MNLALIGKNISHSNSPGIYKYLLGEAVAYHLIDVDKMQDLPAIEFLESQFLGINITTPYKASYLSEVIIENDEIKNLQAINCIKFHKGKSLATNTDYLALEEILRIKYLNDHLILLGNGIMAKILLSLCHKLKISHELLHRQNGLNEFSEFHNSNRKTTIVNCCSRSFQLKSMGNREIDFWDLNYSHIPHQSTLPFKFKSYTDGQELLWAQARKAIEFWVGKKC